MKEEKGHKFRKRLTRLLISVFILILIFFLLLINHCGAQWVQQNLPLTSGYFHDMKFVNANTGFISNSTPLLIKTTNAGFNWQVLNDYDITSISTVDSTYIYGAGHRNGHSLLYKSTNCGLSWDSLLPYGEYYASIYFFNRDTGIISGFNGLIDAIWRTTNGGQSASLITTINWTDFTKLFFLKEKVNGEYWGIIYDGPFWYKTTNSGLSWQAMPNVPDYPISCISFVNQDTGWATVNNNVNYILYTTNGGNNWGTQILPSSQPAHDIYFANPRKGWIGFGQNICATSNGGLNWGMQSIPGTVPTSSKLFFLDSLTGWTTAYLYTLAHTTNGGGQINQIINSNEQIVKDFILFQNYPNPFNSVSSIKYQVKKSANVKIVVYNINGKKVATLVNEKKPLGEYEVKFNGNYLSSGIYFYSLFADGERVGTKRMVLIK